MLILSPGPANISERVRNALTRPDIGHREPTPTPGISGEIPAGLFLRITNLPKEGVVRTSTFPISGITDPDAVVSVNGVLVDVNSAGEFTSTVLLQPEPNLIEVVASDFQGNKVSAVLTIIYIP